MSVVSCPNCGHPNADTAKFCAKCGQKLTPAATMVMGALDDSAALPPPTPSAPMSAKEQAAYSPPAFAPTPRPAPLPSAPPPAPAPAYTPPMAPPPAPAPAYAPPAADPLAGAGAHRFVAMRTIAGLCNVLAWISLVLGFLGGLIWGYVLGSNLLGSSLFGIVGGLIVGVIAGGLGWIYWRLLGEGIWLALDIEANTRRTAAALEAQRR